MIPRMHIPIKTYRPPRPYLASPFSRQREMADYAIELRARGIEPCSTWHDRWEPGDDSQTQFFAEYAEIDLVDLRGGDSLILFTDTVGRRGGLHVEFGIALAYGYDLAVVGPRTHIFSHLPSVLQFDSWNYLIDKLTSTGYIWDR